MSNLDVLSRRREKKCVFADNLAAAHGGESDRTGAAGAGVAIAAGLHHVAEPYTATACDSLA